MHNKFIGFLIATLLVSIAFGQPSDSVAAGQEKIGAADVQRLTALIDHVTSAVQAGDVNQAERAASDLMVALTRLRQQTAPTSAQRLQHLEEKAVGVDTLHRFYALKDLAETAFDAGDLGKAQSYADELLVLGSSYPKDWNYGNAIYYGNFVLGRVALRGNDTNKAKMLLLAAGQTPGSPQLNSFGPNVMLAKELLANGERDAVLEYFALCKSFWKMDRGLLDEWSATVRAGGMPVFRSNLNY
jgi:hypothetical protein